MCGRWARPGAPWPPAAARRWPSPARCASHAGSTLADWQPASTATLCELFAGLGPPCPCHPANRPRASSWRRGCGTWPSTAAGAEPGRTEGGRAPACDIAAAASTNQVATGRCAACRLLNRAAAGPRTAVQGSHECMRGATQPAPSATQGQCASCPAGPLGLTFMRTPWPRRSR